jgi:hypothetical protein
MYLVDDSPALCCQFGEIGARLNVFVLAEILCDLILRGSL